MPNSIGRNKKATSGSPETEIQALREELDALKSSYVRDVQNIESDMMILHEKITSTQTE